MFIFKRPFQAVAAGIAVPLLIVLLDRLANADEMPPVQSPVAVRTAAATSPADAHVRLVPRPRHGVSSAPVRDLSLSCRLPPALTAFGFRV
jgi:hypothetical protein